MIKVKRPLGEQIYETSTNKQINRFKGNIWLNINPIQ
jgi:hypothetical protein